MKILEQKRELRPVIYPKYKEIHERVLFSHWHHHELDIEPDILDWYERLNDTQKRVIGNLFKAFTLAEGEVNCYWTWLKQHFHHPEIRHMCSAFANQEVNHALAYDFFEAHLPLNQVATSDFNEDPVAQQKLETIIAAKDIKDLPLSIAVFSGFVEGVSLYSSFATLMSFTKKGLLKTMFQVLLWSVRDERLHSDSGIKLYWDLLNEGYDAPNPLDIYHAADLIVKNERDFVTAAYGETEDLGFVNLEQSLAFINHRANKKLMQLQLKPVFENNYAYKPLGDFFYTALEGRGMNDFFALSRNGGGYSASITQNFSKCVVNI